MVVFYDVPAIESHRSPEGQLFVRDLSNRVVDVQYKVPLVDLGLEEHFNNLLLHGGLEQSQPYLLLYFGDPSYVGFEVVS